MFPEQINHLRDYQEIRWGLCASTRWIPLCQALREYEARCRSVAINPERKWEVVSAFQKAVRRGIGRRRNFLLVEPSVPCIDSLESDRGEDADTSARAEERQGSDCSTDLPSLCLIWIVFHPQL